MIGFYAAVAAGGAIGASLRWVIAEALSGEPGGLPVATLLVNLLGCLLLGIFLGLAARSTAWARVRPFVAVGVLGGFTTYSAFAVETVTLLEDGAVTTAIGYAVVSIVGGIGLVRLGETLGSSPGGGAGARRDTGRGPVGDTTA